MEKLGHDGVRIENLVTLRSNRSVNYIPYGEKREREKQRTALDGSSITRIRYNTYATGVSSDEDGHRGSSEEGQLGEHV